MALADTTQARNPENLAGLVIPSRSEFDAVLSPYIVRRMPIESAEWQEIYSREARREQKKYRRQQLLRFLPWRRHARPQTLVSNSYETHWSAVEWPRTYDPKPDERTVVAIWGEEGLLIRHYGRKRAHHLLFTRLIQQLRPKRALEAGCGNGLNLLIMSTLFPEIEWSGLELTEAGVQVGRSVQAEAELPQVLKDYAVLPVVDPTAHRRVDLRQGDASKLPFGDREFDLVFTFQALEQMQSLRDQAVAEIARVAHRHVIALEPFAEFNRSQVQRHYMTARGYLQLSIQELPSFALRPFFVFDDWPQNVRTGAGLVAAERQ